MRKNSIRTLLAMGALLTAGAVSTPTINGQTTPDQISQQYRDTPRQRKVVHQAQSRRQRKAGRTGYELEPRFLNQRQRRKLERQTGTRRAK